jgi:peptide deformylase
VSILEILEYPDPRLREKAQSVAQVDTSIQQLVDDMFETMYADHGVGLAATQVGVNQRIILMDFSSDKSEPYTFINPEIIEHDGTMLHAEGCLSVPGFYEDIERYRWIKVKALNRDGEEFIAEFEGEDGRSSLCGCVQHEMDHLEGKLFVDYLSKLKRERILKKLAKIQRVRM